jgi:peptidoglycan/LPS O-acetylase OafA/YrhL
VVNYHNIVSTEAGRFLPFASQPTQLPWLDFLSFSPFRFLFAGGQAVHLFFLVSGFVLGYQVLTVRTKAQIFIKGRLARLYLPVWPALAIAIFASMLTIGSWRVEDWTTFFQTNWGSWLLDASLFPGAGKTLGALWSLTWEVLFSIVIVAAISHPRFFVNQSLIPLWILLIVIGDCINIGLIEYLPMFFLGVAMIPLRASVARVLGSIKDRFRAACEWSVLGLSVLGLVSAFMSAPVLGTRINLSDLQTLFLPLELLSIMSIILLAVEGISVRKALSTPVPQWLGKVSFSLYLTHQSVIQILLVLMPGSPLQFPMTLALSLLIAGLYHFLVESRFHRFSRGISLRYPN